MRPFIQLIILIATAIAAACIVSHVGFGPIWQAVSFCMFAGFGFGFCCCVSCEPFFTDDFSTALADWTASSGTWFTVSGRLQTSSSNAIIICDTVTPAGDGNMRMSVQASADSTVTSRFILGYVDSANYHFCDIKWGTSGTVTLKRKTSNSDTQLATSVFVSSGTLDFKLCLSDTGFFSVNCPAGQFGLSGTTVVPSSASGWGFGTVGSVSGSVKFYDVVLAESSEDCPCNGMCSYCDGAANPRTVIVQLTGVPGTCCSGWDGTYHCLIRGNGVLACSYDGSDTGINPCSTANLSATSGPYERGIYFAVNQEIAGALHPTVTFTGTGGFATHWYQAYQDDEYASNRYPEDCQDRTLSGHWFLANHFVYPGANAAYDGCDFGAATLTVTYGSIT